MDNQPAINPNFVNHPLVDNRGVLIHEYKIRHEVICYGWYNTLTRTHFFENQKTETPEPKNRSHVSSKGTLFEFKNKKKNDVTESKNFLDEKEIFTLYGTVELLNFNHPDFAESTVAQLNNHPSTPPEIKEAIRKLSDFLKKVLKRSYPISEEDWDAQLICWQNDYWNDKLGYNLLQFSEDENFKTFLTALPEYADLNACIKKWFIKQAIIVSNTDEILMSDAKLWQDVRNLCDLERLNGKSLLITIAKLPLFEKRIRKLEGKNNNKEAADTLNKCYIAILPKLHELGRIYSEKMEKTTQHTKISASSNSSNSQREQTTENVTEEKTNATFFNPNNNSMCGKTRSAEPLTSTGGPAMFDTDELLPTSDLKHYSHAYHTTPSSSSASAPAPQAMWQPEKAKPTGGDLKNNPAIPLPGMVTGELKNLKISPSSNSNQ